MFKFFVDAYADMFGEELEANGLNLAPSKIKFGKQVLDFKGYTSPEHEAECIKNVKAKRYEIVALTEQEWFDFFSAELKEGNEVIFFSVGFKMLEDKGENIKKVFAKLNKEFPSKKAILVDTRTVSRGTSEIASLSKLVYNKSQNIDEALDFADTIIGKFVSVFAIDDAENIFGSPLFKKPATAFSGASLGLKPIVSIDTEGMFKLLDRAKGFRSAVSKLYSNLKENGQNVADYTFSIVSFNADSEAQVLYERFLKIVTEREVRLVKMSLNNATIVGGKCIALTFHSRF